MKRIVDTRLGLWGVFLVGVGTGALVHFSHIWAALWIGVGTLMWTIDSWICEGMVAAYNRRKARRR